MEIELRNSLLIGVSTLEAITAVLVRHAKATIPNFEQEVLDMLKAGTPNAEPVTAAAVEARLKEFLAIR
ncbi:hypothetical protein [Stenotrophomonas indicatrix]|jgi:hypothetical protein|uniref:hypothetical protein n=1 Tax=Stenotrophomonas indicatrix TaxID=2045451 RepID=UPI001CBAA342|nr:hypothetical protein [Stenotrophomonas indicatrix]